MQLSPPVSAFLAVLDRMSPQAIVHRDALGHLLEAAYRGGKTADLSALAFTGKFCVRAWTIMKRIGTQGEGYARVAAEFSGNVESARERLGVLLSAAPEETRRALAERYLGLDTESLEKLLGLLADLSRVKNWEIDNPGTMPW